MAGSTSSGCIYTGVGGWTYEPWRDNFYPKGLPHARELDYAGQHLTAIEINGTYYGTQKRETWQKWAAAVPEGFVFTAKASRFCTNRKVLADGADSIAKFLGQGIAELGPKLGPILWQFMGTKRFERDDFARFLDLLPAEQEGVRLRHAIEPRHESFVCAEFVELARDRGCAVVFADHAEYPMIADLTAPFVYARLQQSRADEPTGYDAAELDRWAGIARAWAAGKAPEGLAYAAPATDGAKARDVFLFFIAGAKERNPAAAQALIAKVQDA
ncbi:MULTISPECIES: DUF72 domain-containing protein [unclassified Sphingomonas]|uniref:DUF72 domain-containing protein n=1 Tax=unclassified Sphingomonas TaxID=196159 RepID=UPI0006F9C088|nr:MULTISPECIES: DUF72 domain-containing protein [unclassified Sphingomonas]KQX24853.1 hypothetical protein ASD17_24370 [Sphingomonas sp. Root1294]KQY69841.1 hypothetical protein ASD39_24485 [Sphingomonas sp. Root50]KRB93956.1 hypothetical protein ASE22_24875 [Sphingomonas sp. Root720]